MNQALGRCIRHRKDWGAVIFLDQRLTLPRNIQKLSKWVRPNVKVFPKFVEGIDALRVFMKSKGDVKLPEEHLLQQGADVNSNEDIPTDNQSSCNTKSGPAGSFFFDRKGGKTLGVRNKRPFQ